MRMQAATLALVVIAAGAAPFGVARAEEVGVVNVSRLSSCAQAQAGVAALENEFAGRRRDLENQREQDLKAKEDKLQKDGAVMAANERANAAGEEHSATGSASSPASRTSSWRT